MMLRVHWSVLQREMAPRRARPAGQPGTGTVERRVSRVMCLHGIEVVHDRNDAWGEVSTVEEDGLHGGHGTDDVLQHGNMRE